MVLSSPYHQIKGHPVDLNTETNQVYSDEFKHVVIYYYVSARSDERYKDVCITISGKKFMQALFSRDIVSNWTLFGGTFIIQSGTGTISISNKRAVEILCKRFCYQTRLPGWELMGYGYLRNVVFAESCSDSLVTSSEGLVSFNEETPLFPPTIYVKGNRRNSIIDPSSSRKLYNIKRQSSDKRKFAKHNNQYVDGALYHHIPNTCEQIVPDMQFNSRIVVKVKVDNESWSRIVLTKYHPKRLRKLNHVIGPFHEAFESTSTGKIFSSIILISFVYIYSNHNLTLY